MDNTLINLAQASESPWQTGNPPEPGWYIVTEQYLNIAGKIVTESTAMWWVEDKWQKIAPEEYASWSEPYSEILAWQPLPEPYQGSPNPNEVRNI